MRGRFYRLIRDLHMYLGLFISPFVLVFAISVFFLVHSWLPRIASETSTTRVVSALPLPRDLQMLSGRPLIDALKPTLEKADVRGEVGFVRHMAGRRCQRLEASAKRAIIRMELNVSFGKAAQR